MQPNLQRFLPIILIVFVLLFVLPTILHKKSSSSGPSTSTLSTQTIGAMGLVDRTERRFKAAHGRYTAHVADLLALSPALGPDLADGVAIELDVSTDGQTFYAQVASGVLDLVRGRTGAKEIANGCLIVKSGSGVACPAKSSAGTTTSATATVSRTTGATTTAAAAGRGDDRAATTGHG